MAEKRTIDWEAIEREYRAGQLSIREIAAQAKITHPAIIQRAKREGWARDLTKRIRERVTTKLLTEDITVTNARDEEIINQAAVRAVEIIKLHREDSKTQQGIIRRLMVILNGRVNQDQTEPTLDDVRNCGSVMRDCSQAFSKLVAIERQAYGIDSDGRRPDQIEEITIKMVSPRVEEV